MLTDKRVLTENAAVFTCGQRVEVWLAGWDQWLGGGSGKRRLPGRGVVRAGATGRRSGSEHLASGPDPGNGRTVCVMTYRNTRAGRAHGLSECSRRL